MSDREPGVKAHILGASLRQPLYAENVNRRTFLCSTGIATMRILGDSDCPRRGGPLRSRWARASCRHYACAPSSCKCYFAAHVYELADPAGPFEYFGYSGYEHIGKLRSPAVTVTDFPGALPLSTQSRIRPRRLYVLGICWAAISLPSPSTL